MRVGELGFVILTALLMVMVIWWPVRPGLRLRVTQTVIAVTAVVLVLHLILEFPRFLLLPAAVVFTVLVAVTWRRAARLDSERGGGKRWVTVARRSAATLVGGALVATSGVAVWALPVLTPPATSGPYAVGAHSEVFVDENRTEPRITTATLPRSIPATIWYPAEATEGQRPLGYDPEVPEALTANLSAPAVVLGHLQRISTNTFQDAQPASGRFPVLLYSPGFGSTRYESMALITELVSHGYVVVGMDHAGTSGVVTAHNGERILADLETMDSGDDSAGLVEERAQDANVVLDSLSSTKLAETMDLDRVGMLGFSFGGATAAEALRTDPRVQAALNIDGPFHGNVTQEAVGKPLMTLHHDPGTHPPEEQPEVLHYQQDENDLIRGLNGTNYHVATVQRTQHPSFNDTFAVVPLMGNGLLPHTRMVELLRPLIRDWFDHQLRGEPLRMVGKDLPEYPEIVWQN
ncbi:hypothetical protein [Arachnia propionica]|uniref:1-alkyl-2-acetylglycerophosphocholine esterase n=1 Tax=Arachnia propionica TaxID=1750 RepID=A0A3P1WZT4_9ACTN|nr:hypothetical protein [Arachnia propionica]RRD49943.1 hypothetical protein EII35_06125 [Arachnia propionica]